MQADRRVLIPVERPLTLGELITKLEALPQDIEIRFDFCGFKPAEFGSWRGSYSNLALGFNNSDEDRVLVSYLLARAKEANGSVMFGYKGGEYLMDEDTPVWVDNYGISTETAIVDVRLVQDYLALLITKYVEY